MSCKKSKCLPVLFVILLAASVNVSGYDKQLRDDFKNPPREYTLIPFWSWNDTLEADKIKWQIDQMVEKGIYGAFMHAREGLNESKTPYFSDGWWDAIGAAVTYGKKVGFNPWIYDEDRWPSGVAGGRTLAVNPEEFSQKGLMYSEIQIDGPQNIILSRPDKLVGVIIGRIVSKGVVEPNSLADISDFSGKQWNVPEGKWLIMTFRKVKEEKESSRPQRGIDYLDKEAVAAFIKITHEEYYKRFGEYFGNVVPGVFFDEISAKMSGADFTWTDDFLEKFREKKGYDLKKYLPLLVYDGGNITPKIRCDYYDVFTSLYVEAWFEQISNWCSEHNVPLTGHTYEDIFSYVTQGDYFRTFAPVQIPMTDSEDFRYSYPPHIEWFKPKQVSSIAHINGRKFAGVEGFGGNRPTYTLEETRYGIEMLAVYGINYMVAHLFHYSTDTPQADGDYPPSWFYQNPFWKYFGQEAKFAQRVLYMGSRGRHICDVAILYPITSQWASGRNTGGDGKEYDLDELNDILPFQYWYVQRTLLENQIDYDIIDPVSILRADVSAGKIDLASEKYSVLILPPLSVIGRDTIEKIKSFYERGGTVIAMNTLPTSSPEEGKRDSMVAETIEDIFGFNPTFVRSGYYDIDRTYSNEFVANSNSKNGKAYFTKYVERIPSIVEKAVAKDVTIKKGSPAGFCFLHRTTEDSDIYYLVNSQKVPRKWGISFRCTGGIERWCPETGETEKIYGLKDKAGRTELSLSFEPWQSYYIVFDRKSEDAKYNFNLGDTNLRDAKITDVKKNKITVEGLERTGTEPVYVNMMASGLSPKEEVKKWKGTNSLPEINLGGEWDFIPVGKLLDYKWQPRVESSQFELPVMEFCAAEANEGITAEKLLATTCEGIYWKQIKVKDKRSKLSGCERYLTSWDGWWLTYGDLKPHWGSLGGKEIKFRKKVVVGDKVKNGWLCITADKQYKLSINNKAVGENGDWREPKTYDITQHLTAGENIFDIVVKNAGGLLLQGEIALEGGKNIEIVSDKSWDICNETGLWIKAFEYINPPLGPWGDVELKNKPLLLPLDVWYRQQLPKGAVGITVPVIKGDFQIFVNGQAVKFTKGQERITFKELLNSDKNVLLVKVTVRERSEGLIEPITVICEPAKVNPAPWENYGLNWYSGRCVYSNEVTIPKEYLASDTKLILDLGEVNYFAEVWVNDKLAGVRIWPPYEVEVGNYLKPGRNTISLIAANLVTNEMTWNIFDQSLTDFRARWAHDLGIAREPDKLRSGVLGPVKIVPFKKRIVEISIPD